LEEEDVQPRAYSYEEADLEDDTPNTTPYPEREEEDFG
jgi:hypothetical protein